RPFAFGPYVQSLRKTVEVGPRGSATLALLQPDLQIPFGNDADVEVDGYRLDGRLSLEFARNRGTRTAAGHFFGRKKAPNLFTAVSILTTNKTGAAFAGAFAKFSVGSIYQPLCQPGPEDWGRWPDLWLGYSSFDGIMLDAEDFQGAPAEVQAAMIQYVECGGALLLMGNAKVPESWKRTAVAEPPLTAYYAGYGVCVVSTTPFSAWEPNHYRKVTDTWATARNYPSQVTSPWTANNAFPVLADVSVPVRGLFILMVLFAILIGPVNVLWLSRIKRRIWMIGTVPALSFFTCVALAGYLIVVDGWYGHVRATGITVLDENSQRAATIGWLGYYCPTTPSRGLRFSADMELTPHFAAEHAGRRGLPPQQPCSIDWNNGQHLTNGWISAKVPLHFLVRRGEKRLERITVRKSDDGTVSAVNGLGVGIQSLYVARTDGVIFAADEIAAGGSATLTKRPDWATGHERTLADVFAGDWLRAAQQMVSNPAQHLRRGCYLAVLDEAPFLEVGLSRTQSRNLRTVVYGIMKEPLEP
ncbi:MAG: hypothetical protein NZO58_09495, partial [Gemmataceae bacterium]|nr:hypothetical protein [Gemmataceae bacterium]